MKEGWSVRVLGYADDHDEYTGIGYEDYKDWEDEEIIETLKEYDKLEFWGEKY